MNPFLSWVMEFIGYYSLEDPEKSQFLAWSAITYYYEFKMWFYFGKNVNKYCVVMPISEMECHQTVF